MQVRQQRCATRQHPKEFGCFFSFKIKYASSSQKSTHLAFGHLAICCSGIDRTKVGPLGTRGFGTYFLLLTTPYVMFE